MTEPFEPCDVLIIGGGPAGSTAATLLARRGKDVVVLEKEHHPRFHIGESLLPRNLVLLERLGVADKVAAIGTFKPGAEFVSDETGARVDYAFAAAPGRPHHHAWQVRRSEFDAILFANARRAGARAMEGTRVTEVGFEPGGRARVTALDGAGKTRGFAPGFVLDGSGRDTFLAGRLRTRQADKRNSTASVFAHFRHVEARTDTMAGCVGIHLVENGWVWMIPLPDDVMSVGFVGNQAAFKDRRGTMAEFFAERLLAFPTVRARMKNAERISDVQAAGNYSYCASSSWGEGWMMIGDAFTFIDPVFSSGVLLAMTAGELGADVASTWLESATDGRVAARRAEARIRAMTDGFAWLINRINTPVLRAMFMGPSNTLRMRDGLIALLSGDPVTDWRSRLPLLAMKGTFHTLSVAHRLGLRIE